MTVNHIVSTTLPRQFFRIHALNVFFAWPRVKDGPNSGNYFS